MASSIPASSERIVKPGYMIAVLKPTNAHSETTLNNRFLCLVNRFWVAPEEPERSFFFIDVPRDVPIEENEYMERLRENTPFIHSTKRTAIVDCVEKNGFNPLRSNFRPNMAPSVGKLAKWEE